VNEQGSLAWSFTLDRINAIRPFLRAAERQGVSLSVAQPSLYALLDARTAAARRGRRRKAKTEPVAPGTTTTAPATTATTALQGAAIGARA
jgi:hypothetical protein